MSIDMTSIINKLESEIDKLQKQKERLKLKLKKAQENSCTEHTRCNSYNELEAKLKELSK